MLTRRQILSAAASVPLLGLGPAQTPTPTQLARSPTQSCSSGGCATSTKISSEGSVHLAPTARMQLLHFERRPSGILVPLRRRLFGCRR